MSTTFLFKMTLYEVSLVCLVVFSNFLILKESISLYNGYWISMYVHILTNVFVHDVKYCHDFFFFVVVVFLFCFFF